MHFRVINIDIKYSRKIRLLAKISGNKAIAKELVELGITKYISIIFKPFVRKTLNEPETYQLLYILKLIQNTAVLGEDIANEYNIAKESKISVLEDIKTQITVKKNLFVFFE